MRWVSLFCLPLAYISLEVLRGTDGKPFWKEWMAGALALENGWRSIKEMEGRVENQCQEKKEIFTVSSVQARVLQGASILRFLSNTHGLPSAAF